MAMKFNKISEDAFDNMQLEAGVLLSSFTPSSAVAPSDSDIIAATTGGINVSCVPQYADFGEDVDNCPNNTKELKYLTGYECKMGATILDTTPEAIKLALGAADITASTSKITPRATLAGTDFTDLWWVGDKADGGMVAVKLSNALSTGGFVLKTGKNAKGQVTIELTGHVSLADTSVVPMEFYSTSASA